MIRCAAHGFPAVLALLALLVPAPCRAQAAHYWTQQYGPEAGLLGGAVIGSVDNLSATFYNPAGLSLVRDPGFALSAQVFELESITLEDGAGEGVDLGTSRSGLQPSLIAGRLPFGGEDHTWAYSLLSRQRVRNDISTSLILGPGEIDPSEELESVVGIFRVENNIRDTWTGLTWAHRPGSRLGVGVTTFFGYRQQDNRSEIIAQTLREDGQGAASVEVQGFDVKSLRVVWKLGLMWKLPNLDLGLTVTTPGLHLWGGGRAGANRGQFGVDEGDALDADLRDGLDVEYRSPLSVGVGGAWSFGNSRLHVSAEWFDAIELYDIVSTPALDAGGDSIQVGVTHAAKSVVNWGAGLQHTFSPRVAGFVSFVVDQSAAPNDATNTVGLAPWDIGIGTVGADFAVGEINLTLGVGMGFGDTDFQQVVDFFSLGDGDIFDDTESTRLTYRSWRFIFGFEL